jgi:hypothetical protein
MLSVINGKKYGFIGQDRIYIGRTNKYYRLNASPLANPFQIGSSMNRTQSIEAYRERLWQSIKLLRDKEVCNAQMVEIIRIAKLDSHQSLKLVCYCSPLPCHGDVIVSAIQWLKSQQWFKSYLL